MALINIDCLRESYGSEKGAPGDPAGEILEIVSAQFD